MKNTVSLKLNGDVMLSDFAKVLNHLSTLIDELTSEICVKEDIEWEIVKLESGSATTVIAAISADQSAIERIIQAYELIGQSISDNKPIPFNETIASEARSITNVINGKVKSVEFFTDDYKAIIEKSVEAQIQEQESDFSFGTVTGVVETLSKRGRMRFVLYDTLFDKAVNCYLAKDQENLMLDAWDKKILVAGKVSREPKTGRPYQVKDINYVEQKISSPPGSFFVQKGLLNGKKVMNYPKPLLGGTEMTNKNGKLIYWDSCVFLSYINGIPNRLRTINDILEEVTKDADGKILTSSESIVEVAHALYEKENKQLDPIVEEAIDAMWDDSSVINMIDNGPHISKIARKLIRDAIPSNWVLKSKDAVHLASAMWYDKNICSIAELHTYDEGLFKYQAMIGIPVVLPHTDQLRLHFTDDK